MRTGKTGWENPEFEPKRTPFPCTPCKKKPGRNTVFPPGLWQGQKDLSRLSPRSGLDAAHRAAGPHDTHCAGAQPCLVAESLCALTKKERQADACLSFLAGAEGLEPSARGFGVDVGKRTGNGEGARWRRIPSQAIKRRCWFGAAKKPGQKREGKPSLGHLKIFALLTNSKQREKMV